MSIWTDKQGRLHVGIMASGQRVHRTLAPGASARDAKLIEAELRRSIAKRGAPVVAGDPQLVECMGLYIRHCDTLRSPQTAKYHALRIGPWIEQAKASDARKVSAKIVADMRDHYSAATINRSLSALKTALRMAHDAGLIDSDYASAIKMLPLRNQREVFLSVDQVDAIAAHASETVRAAIWIALYTGCRRGEVLKLQPADIGDDSLTIHAGNTKTLRTRVIPITPALRPWLRFVPLALNFEGLKSGFGRARAKAGMEHVNFHDLRHSTASLLLASGVDLFTISRILGHTTTRMTERYSHLQVDAQRDALTKAFG